MPIARNRPTTGTEAVYDLREAPDLPMGTGFSRPALTWEGWVFNSPRRPRGRSSVG
jgi:hypothetical protein